MPRRRITWGVVCAVLGIVLAVHGEEKSLAQEFAERSYVSELAENSRAALVAGKEVLGESAEPTDSEFLNGLLTDYDKNSWKNFASFIPPDEPGVVSFDEPARYMRHLDSAMVITTISNHRDQGDAAWVVREPLCAPGDVTKNCPALADGQTNCMSLESSNYKGWYISKDLTEDKVELRQATPSQEAHQTVCFRPGLHDDKKVSLEFMSSPGKFISNRISLLRVCSEGGDDAGGECGTLSAADFAREATMHRVTGKFVGQCMGPAKVKECACVDGWKGKRCNSQCPGSGDLGVCNGHGTCDLNAETNGAECQCSPGFLGIECMEKCPEFNSLVCGGTGAGECFLHPHKGPQCKCKTAKRGDLCQFSCPGLDADGDPEQVCSNHGVCSMNEVGDGAQCGCDKGFLGEDCSRECPVHDGHICGGFGKCEIDQFGEASCVCEPSRRGKACELMCPRNALGFVCAQNGACVVADGAAACACEDGFLGDGCDHKCPGLIEGRVCSGHGVCNVKEEEGVTAPKCTCDTTHGGTDCLLACPTDSEGNVCNGHGTCAGEGKCKCQTGYLGDGCESECPHVEGEVVCNGHGKCHPPTEEGGPTTCECDVGFKGDSCANECPKYMGSVCAGKGKCVLHATSGAAKCVCEHGIKGESCQFKCPGLLTDHVCSGHGECALHPNARTPVSATCHKCMDGFVGDDCSLRCPGLGEDGKPCSGHGMCDRVGNRAQCTCDDGFKGPGCHDKCPVDKTDRPCSMQGSCRLVGDITQCSCKAGFMGDACEYECPRNTIDNKICSDRGECKLAATGDHTECDCKKGTIGRACDTGCPTGSNKLPCSGHGQCLLLANAGGCKCNDGWSGDDCGKRTCTSSTAVFNKMTGQCICPAGNVCCEPAALRAKQAKEAKIRLLEAEGKELHSTVRETERMLTEAMSRR